MAEKNSNGNGAFEEIESERKDRESSPASYEIVTYPADFTLEVLVNKWQRGGITIPGFQRHFVWTQVQASKLIESFLLGLPVPPIFLFENAADSSLLVVDGQQRLKSVMYFYEGYFGEEKRGKRPVFRLIGLHEQSPFHNMTCADLNTNTLRKLNDATLRSFIVKQLNPEDDTSIYHIFERLNTGGTQLQQQEIRNCLLHGTFNNLIVKNLNKSDKWREIFGRKSEDRRQRDIELILRFFALLNNGAAYEKPMKDFLTSYMSKNREPSEAAVEQFATTFERTVDAVHSHLGAKPFHLRAGLNTAAFDATFVAFARNLDRIPGNVSVLFDVLAASDDFLDVVSAGTTDKEVISKRLKLTEQKLFG